MIGLKRGTVQLCEHEKEWEIEAQNTIARLKEILGDVIKDIQHVGSTSILTIKAKPIIDIAVAVDEFDDILAYEKELKDAGFYYRPNAQASLRDQLLFACGNFYEGTGDLQTHFIHVVLTGSMDWINYINFRDYLNRTPSVAKEYEDLKVSLAEQAPIDSGREKYLKGKHEVEFLEEYGFLQVQKDKYIVNFIISEPTAELLTMQNDMYKRAAELFANDLYDELTSSGILDDPDIWCGQTDAPISLTESPKADRNFVLWSLIPYIAAWSGEKLMDESIFFEEVATIRPDGAHNIYHASVVPDEMVLPDDYVYMRNWCGPMWNKGDYQMMWQIDSEWSDRAPVKERNIPEEQERTITLLNWEKYNLLSKHDYAWLAERGYIKTNGDYDGHFKSAWQIVVLASNEIRDKLLAIGERIKVKYQTEFDALKAPYAEAVLESVPAHLRKIKAYELQFVFHADGWFLVHCITALLKNGKLKEPTEGQRKSLTTLIANV